MSANQNANITKLNEEISLLHKKLEKAYQKPGVKEYMEVYQRWENLNNFSNLYLNKIENAKRISIASHSY